MSEEPTPQRFSSSRRGRPSPVHEELARTINDLIHQAIDEMATTVGTVAGTDGGNIRVHIDDEEGPRQVGFPKKHGQKYTSGDRVLLHRMKGKDWVVGGSIGGGDRRVVGQSEMEPDSVDKQIIHPEVQNDIDSAYNIGDRALGAAGTAKDRADAAKSRADDAYSLADHDHPYSRSGHSHSEYATEQWVKDNFRRK